MTDPAPCIDEGEGPCSPSPARSRMRCDRHYRKWVSDPGHRAEVESAKAERARRREEKAVTSPAGWNSTPVRKPRPAAGSRAQFLAAEAAALSSPPRSSLDSVPRLTALRELSLGLPVHHLTDSPEDAELLVLQRADEQLR